MSEDKDTIERLTFMRQGEHGMQVEIVGDGNTLMSMFHSALMSHRELRKLLMPVFMKIIKDDDFIKITMQDMIESLSDQTPEDDVIDTE